ncbi:hypothetical protein LZ575_05780 [Antarcticibacterium sp. 1MA-6-2]|uniref:hypothetical protein n=1 Tax=Antarcticibacterium sp. 1MA-6-2 TaxID=2908210 RepID=UPI001F2F82AF|nr:hypothetical protein [Antarcticibacterium sp. 1MA-6-2]UJH92106.1 hypothetical protein LZ575_05780 [Antarcticibacterium sp. 1MA-6-2]
MTERFKISKIELSNSETKVHLEWNIPEGWWVQYGADTFLRDPETGEKFTIIKIENEEFDTRIDIGPSGTHHSVFVFPPLKEGIEKIDYNDQFYGLYLNGKQPEKSSEVPDNVTKWLNSELAKVKKEPIQNYESERFFSKEPAKIIGYIKGYDPRLGFETGIYYASNQLTREDYPVTIEISEDGRFETDIPLIHPVESFLIINNRLMKFYLEPGQTLALTLNWKHFLQAEHFNSRYYPADSVIFGGNLARINEELFNLEFSSFDYEVFEDNVLNLKATDLKKEALKERKKNDQLLDQYFAENDLLEKTKIVLTQKKKLITATLLFNYLMYKKDFQRQYPDNDILREEIPIEFYSFIKDLDMNKQSLLIIRDFPEFINRFEYADPINFHASYKKFTPEVSQLEYFELQNIPLTEEEKNLWKLQSFETPEEHRKV